MTSSRDLLDRLLEGKAPTPEEIQELIRAHTKEDSRLEYKRGEWLVKETDSPGDPKDPGVRLRKYVTGFANGDGGVLLIGVAGGEESQASEKWSIVGCPPPPEAGWKSWAGQVLSTVAARAMLSIHEVPVQGQIVLAVAVDRASNLIEVLEQSRLLRYLRVDEHTVRITDTLYADFVLGRRARPEVSLLMKDVRAHQRSAYGEIEFEVQMHNDGLVWIPEAQIGVIGFAREGQDLTRSLLQYTDVRAANSTDSEDDFAARLNVRSIERGVRPFEIAKVSFRIQVPQIQQGPWRWQAALFANPSNGNPVWACLDVYGSQERSNGTLTLARESTRPTVSWTRGSGTWSA